MTFAEFFEKNLYDTRLALPTVLSMKATLGVIRKLGMDIPIDGVDRNWLKRFDSECRARKKNTNTINKYHRHIRKFIGMAIDEDLILSNPYDRFKPEGVKTTRKFLTEQERDLIVSSGGFFAELFEFQTLVGMHVSDLLLFCKEKIEEITVDGSQYRVIRGNRKKNGELYVTPLSNRAGEIAEKYNYKFVFEPNKYNEWLKTTASNLGIAKHVTSSVGRHTYATMALTHGISMEAVSGSMGHTSIKTTEIYGKVLGNKIVKDFVKAGML